MIYHPVTNPTPMQFESLIVKKLSPSQSGEARFRYFFTITAPANQPLTGILTLRVYANWFRLLGTTQHFRIDLQPGQTASFALQSPFLFRRPRYRYQMGKHTGAGTISPLREDLTALIESQPIASQHP